MPDAVVVMHRQNIVVRIITLPITILMVLLALSISMGIPAHAGTPDDKRRLEERMAQLSAMLESATDKAKQAILDYNEAIQALPEAQTALEEAEGKVIGAQSEARRAEKESVVAKAAVELAMKEYEQAEKDVDMVRVQTSKFVSAAYQGDYMSMFSTILEARSPSDTAAGIEYMNRVMAEQRRIMAQFVAARMVARQREDQAKARNDEAQRAHKRAQSALADACAQRDQASKAAAVVQKLIDQKSQAFAAAESEKDAVIAQYNAVKAESDRLGEHLRLAASTSGTNVVISSQARGVLLKPVSGWISSNFGMRFDPYYHVWQLHAGVDYAAPGGSPIVAAADGRVVRTGWAGGYGRYTCIHHGNYQGKSLSTCYAHQSSILVSNGQDVRRGQLIGAVGTTGASTGYHLHFEVRLNGGPVNPLEWL